MALNPTTPLPPPIDRMWDHHNESVDGYDNQVWRIRDLKALVADQPVFEVPLAFIPLDRHGFKADDLVEFARHMRHVLDADLNEPIIFGDRGSVLDGRHRIVKALLEGRTTILAKRVPNGSRPTTTHA